MYKYVFGPVPSRRLGVSLGVDLVKMKTCNLDCIYCECGPTKKYIKDRGEFVKVEELISELKEVLEDLKPDYITFSGGGEPTLNISLGEIVREIKKISTARLALITNSTLLNKEDILEDVMGVDLIMPSIDAVSEEVFLKINRPDKDMKITDITDGIRKLGSRFSGEIYIEVFIVEGINDTQEELKKFASYLKTVRYTKIQLNSLARPGAEGWVKPANIERLSEIKDYFENQGLENVEIIKKYQNRSYIKNYNETLEKLILGMLAKRACSLVDLLDISNIGKNELNKYLDILEKEGKIKSLIKDNQIFLKKV